MKKNKDTKANAIILNTTTNISKKSYGSLRKLMWLYKVLRCVS